MMGILISRGWITFINTWYRRSQRKFFIFDDSILSIPPSFHYHLNSGLYNMTWNWLSTVTFSSNDLVFMSRKFCRTIFHKLDFPPKMSPVRLTNGRPAGPWLDQWERSVSVPLCRQGRDDDLSVGEVQLGSITGGDKTGVGGGARYQELEAIIGCNI